ncbi:LTA synthase family protein [Flavobacterium haoranii]|uniref:Phosphoglycerol transferase MdoB n=1 Tax=Flavobacterium haoranii TaxID=683124 RepID=A0A1M6HM34_9FLAO|nr:alkaline phosphatase family protein [Flavobacterium haoranii]SHJ23194.1 Phosphoglycerol transferase MdoB [Flavobacterium haoranii]
MLPNFDRYQLLKKYAIGFILLSFILRIALLFWQISDVELTFLSFFRIIATGLFYDLGVLSFLFVIVNFYLLIMPRKFIGSKLDKAIVYSGFFLSTLIFIFTFFAEITFWEEFHCRFNFVAVDYLIYTYEVVKNINESYPLVILVPSILLIVFGIYLIFKKLDVFQQVFTSKVPFLKRAIVFSTSLVMCLFYVFLIKNNQAEWSSNRYSNEISKAGIYAFFSELRNNKLDYKTFYQTLDDRQVFALIKNKLKDVNSQFIHPDSLEIKRTIHDSLEEIKPNVVFVLMESMSADFMTSFGNEKKLTPFLDSIANKGVFLKNLYATGNRTVRGMEAVTLSIPPTPGQSIVKRQNNDNLFTVASVFKEKKYTCNFFYGGDGYFDNMNAFYGGNGFNIFDRGRGSILADNIKTKRTNINDDEVTHENAWGICDEDIYNKMIKEADRCYTNKERFFNFIMTTSNHRPYTYPEGKIDIPSGKSRDGAVKYSDYALSQLFKKIKNKPWFENTVFVFIADHCASSAGKDEIDVKNYHIPAIIYGASIKPQNVDVLCSQIDIFPTLFHELNWSYKSDFFGENILSTYYEPRALIATYLKLGLLKSDNDLVVLTNKKEVHQYKWNSKTNDLLKTNTNKDLKRETIAWYQTADYLYNNDKLRFP